MTAIAGIQTDTGAWIAADRQVTYGQVAWSDGKIVRLPCGVNLATCGHLRDGQIIQYSVAPRSHLQNETDMQWLCLAFVPAVYDALKAYERKFEDSAAILTYRGRLYHLACDLSIVPMKIAADGSGMEVVLGNLHGSDLTDPKAALTRAIRAAAAQTVYVNDEIDTLFDPLPDVK